MALTSASFVPEKRGVQGPDNYTVGMAKNVDAADGAGSEAQVASFERVTTVIGGASVPYTTGAGQGSIKVGGRRGK